MLRCLWSNMPNDAIYHFSSIFNAGCHIRSGVTRWRWWFGPTCVKKHTLEKVSRLAMRLLFEMDWKHPLAIRSIRAPGPWLDFSKSPRTPSPNGDPFNTLGTFSALEIVGWYVGLSWFSAFKTLHLRRGPFCILLHDTQILMFKLVEWDCLCNMKCLIIFEL